MLDNTSRFRVPLPRLGFGAAQLRSPIRVTSNQEAAHAVDAASTAVMRYGPAPQYGLGRSERRLSEALPGRRRADFPFPAKVGRLLVSSLDAADGFDGVCS